MFNVLLTKILKNTGRSVVNDTLSLALRPLPWPSCWRGREGVRCYLSVSNTINIIPYTDVWHDWRGMGGAGGVEGLLGRFGIGGVNGVISIHLRVWSIYSSMLEIGLNVKDTKNYVQSLVTSHNSAILENLYRVPNFLLLTKDKKKHYPCVILNKKTETDFEL